MATRTSPSARLVSWVPEPFGLVYHEWFFQKHGKVPEANADERFNFVFQLLCEDWCGALEFPTFVWQMVLPRSLHAQVRAHRHWSFWSQSHQLHDAKNFALEEDYFKIPTKFSAIRKHEQGAMAWAQNAYRSLRNLGVLPSLARGVLPMHTNLGLSCSMNLRSLFQSVVMRRCHILQGTYWNTLLEEMRAELVEKVDPHFEEIFNLQPCDINGHCLSDIEQELRQRGADPHAVCPRWVQIGKTQGASNCCGEGCIGCLKSAREQNRKVERSIKR